MLRLRFSASQPKRSEGSFCTGAAVFLWYLVSTEDKMIPPDAQRAMSKRAGSKVVETKGSHAVYVSRPDVVAALIEEAAAASVSTATRAAGSQR
jgi:hypothetical protein